MAKLKKELIENPNPKINQGTMPIQDYVPIKDTPVIKPPVSNANSFKLSPENIKNTINAPTPAPIPKPVTPFQYPANNEKVNVSPSLNPAGVQGIITRQTFDQYQADKQFQNMQRQQMTPDFMNSLGNLTPEQQAMINNSQRMPRGSMISQIAENALKQGAMGAGAGLLGAGPIGAAIGGAGGLLTGAITGIFASYKQETKDNINIIEQNANKAKYNIRQAIMLSNKGGDTEQMSEGFNNALFELRRAQAQLKAQEGSLDWATGIRLKQNDLENYLTYTLPIMQQRMAIALMKPDPAYVDMGLNNEGVPL